MHSLCYSLDLLIFLGNSIVPKKMDPCKGLALPANHLCRQVTERECMCMHRNVASLLHVTEIQGVWRREGELCCMQIW